MYDAFYLPATRAVLSVLVVDEDLLIQRLLVAALHRLGHVTAVVGSGAEMLDWIANGTVDVVLLDLSMAGADGQAMLAALAQLRGREAGGAARQCVLGVTGHAQQGARQQLLRAGADGLVVKPVRLPALAEALAGALAASRASP